MLSLLTVRVIHVHYPDSNGNLVALLNSTSSAQCLSPGCGLAVIGDTDSSSLPYLGTGVHIPSFIATTDTVT